MGVEYICQDVYDGWVKKKRKAFDYAGLFVALGDTTRLRLLNLMAGQEVCVCHFVEVLGESQPKISRHLAYLRRAGVVQARRDGKWMHYSMVSLEDAGAAVVLESVLGAFAREAGMLRDRELLVKACCGVALG